MAFRATVHAKRTLFGVSDLGALKNDEQAEIIARDVAAQNDMKLLRWSVSHGADVSTLVIDLEETTARRVIAPSSILSNIKLSLVPPARETAAPAIAGLIALSGIVVLGIASLAWTVSEVKEIGSGFVEFAGDELPKIVTVALIGAIVTIVATPFLRRVFRR